MSIRATVKNGVIALPEGVTLPDGSEVMIELPASAPRPFAERYADLIGSVQSVLGDLAINHDHYRLGVPKREPCLEGS